MLATLSPISFVSAAAAVASVGALYALHHLRVRPERRVVATLAFWAQTRRSERTSVPWAHRFTHRRTFALLAAIALLAAAALTADRWNGVDEAPRDAIVIDDGASTAGTSENGSTALGATIDAVGAELEAHGVMPTIVLAGPQPVLLSRDGESAVVARRRVSALSPQSGVAASDLALELAAATQGDRPGRIAWFTAAGTLPAGLPAEVARRVDIFPVSSVAAAAITGITFAPDADNPQRGGLSVSVAGESASTLTLVMEPAVGAAVRQSVNLSNREARAMFPDLAADGSELRLQLFDARGQAQTRQATFRVPDERPFTFRCAPGVPRALRFALLGCGSERPDGAVWVGPCGASPPVGVRAAIAVVSDGPTTSTDAPLAFPAGAPPVQDVSFESAIAKGPAVAQGGMPLLAAGTTTLASLDRTAAVPTLTISCGLLDDDADLPRRAAFPMLVRQWCDLLLGGREEQVVVPGQRAAHDPLWPGRLAPGDASAARVLAVSDLPDQSVATRSNALIRRFEQGRIPWTALLLTTALVLLVVESVLLAARKIV